MARKRTSRGKKRSSRRSGSARAGKLYIELGAVPNTDYSHGQHLGSVQIRKHRQPIRTMQEGSDVAQRFIAEHGLGGGNWGGSGNIVDSRGRVLAHVSYNGRIWDAKDQEITADDPRYRKIGP